MASQIIAENGEFVLAVDTVGDKIGSIFNLSTDEVWEDKNVVSVISKPGWELVTPRIIEKHLPGRHPQTSHTPRLYIGGKPITLDYFDDGGSKLVQNLSRDMQQTVMEACVNYKITEEELTDLAGFSMAPDSGYDLNEKGYFYYKADPDEEVLGLYNPDTKVVSIAPALAGRTDGPKVVLHEVGHHVARQNPKYKNRRAAAGFVLSQLRHKGVGPVEAVDYGLREYSFSSENEFMADTYLCLKAGNEIQRRNLNAAYEEIGYEEGMAGVLKQVLLANELISFEKANIVQTVFVPVVIGDRQASETPWYYTNVRAEEQLVKLAGLLGKWKHLPGRHDQKSHAPKYRTVEDLTGQERNILREYSGDAYEDINSDLRSGKSGDYRVHILDDIFSKHKLEMNTIMYRVGSEKIFGENEIREGNEFTDPAFVSVSSSEEFLRKSTHYGGRKRVVLNVPAGIGAISLRDLTGRPYEKETLLERGLRFRITKVGKKYLYVDVLPKE